MAGWLNLDRYNSLPILKAADGTHGIPIVGEALRRLLTDHVVGHKRVADHVIGGVVKFKYNVNFFIILIP